MVTRLHVICTLLLLVHATAGSSDDSSVCWYEGRDYPAGAKVPTSERCLSCRCGERGGAPLCRLQVCPELPVPPPRGCVLVHKRGECCQKLVCETAVDSLDTHSRHSMSKITAEDFEIPADNGCVVNGTRYAEGSATSSSSLCEYCYCVRGEQRCVKPQCEMPLPGCKPRYRSLACCPVSYDCNSLVTDTSTTSTTVTPPKPSGCAVEDHIYEEGSQVLGLADACERCYCLRGAIRCIKLECAPPLMGCTPVFAPGRCCPVQYNCSKIITEPIYHERQKNDISVLLQMAVDDRISSAELRQHREMTEDSTAHMSTDTTAGESSDLEITELTSPHPQIKTTESTEGPYKTSGEESEEKFSGEVAKSDEELTTQSSEENVIESRTETPDNMTPEDTTTILYTSTVEPTEEIAQTTVQDTTLQEEVSTVTIQEISTTTTAPPPPSSPHVLADRVDNLEELTTVAPQETSSVVTSTTTISPPTTLPPLIEALLSAKNKDAEVTENEYGEALPPSLPNITMIPFLPEDAVVDKKKDTYSPTESGSGVVGPVYKPAVPVFLPPAAYVGGFVPRQPPLHDDTPLFYPTSPQPESGDILTAPQASMPPIMISLTTPSPESGNMDSITMESTITLANPSATRDVPLASHIRVASGPRACLSPDGREVAHGDLMASPGPCEVCRCDRGTVLCHEEPSCSSEKPGIQDRVDTDTERFTPPPPGSIPSLPALTAPENKIAEDDHSFSLDSVFDFLFMHGESTSVEPTHPPTTPSTTPAPSTVPRPRPTRPAPQEPPPPPLPAAMAGILKLAGCNIYGRMYRVGRIISELSGPCRECRCTELGVQCRPLRCK